MNMKEKFYMSDKDNILVTYREDLLQIHNKKDSLTMTEKKLKQDIEARMEQIRITELTDDSAVVVMHKLEDDINNTIMKGNKSQICQLLLNGIQTLITESGERKRLKGYILDIISNM